MIKKIGLLAIITGFPFGVLAQQAFDETFFMGTGSEDFISGSVNGQLGWVSKKTDGTPINGCIVTDIVPQSINSDWTPSWPSSLSVGADESFPPATSPLFGCYSPLLITPDAVTLNAELSIMVFIDKDESSSAGGSSYELVLYDGEDITSKIAYLPGGSIKVLDNVNSEPAYMITNATWSDHNWAQLTIQYNFVAGTIEYIIDGVTIYEGNALIGQKLQKLAILHNNTPGSIAYFDDIFVFGSPTAALNTYKPQPVILSPNPARHEFTVIIPVENSLQTIKVFDLNGRILKSITSNTTLSAPINVDDLSAGTYVVVLEGSNFYNQKILIKQ